MKIRPPDGEGRDPGEPRLSRASAGAPPLSAAPRLEKGPAPPPAMPKEEARRRARSYCGLWLLLAGAVGPCASAFSRQAALS